MTLNKGSYKGWGVWPLWRSGGPEVGSLVFLNIHMCFSGINFFLEKPTFFATSFQEIFSIWRELTGKFWAIFFWGHSMFLPVPLNYFWIYLIFKLRQKFIPLEFAPHTALFGGAPSKQACQNTGLLEKKRFLACLHQFCSFFCFEKSLLCCGVFQQKTWYFFEIFFANSGWGYMGLHFDAWFFVYFDVLKMVVPNPLHTAHRVSVYHHTRGFIGA